MSNHQTLHNRLVHSVCLEVPSTTADALGGFTTQWVPLKKLFAEVTPQGQTGSSAGAHVQATLARYRITTYPDAAITLPLRIVWKNRVLHVNSIEDHHTHIVMQAETELSQ